MGVRDDDDILLDEPTESNKDYEENLLDEPYFSGGDMPMERHNDLLKDLTNFDSYIKETINGWLGKYFDAPSGKWKDNPNASPIMNERCAIWCVTYLKTYARKNNIITYIGKDEYNEMICDVIEVVWLNIGGRSEEFGITSSGDILRICTEMEHAIELVLMGAGSGKYQELLKGTYQQAERGGYNPYPPNNPLMPQQKGIIRKTKNWLFGGN